MQKPTEMMVVVVVVVVVMPSMIKHLASLDRGAQAGLALANEVTHLCRAHAREVCKGRGARGRRREGRADSS